MKLRLFPLILSLVFPLAAAAQPSLRGSPASQMKQNEMADRADLTRLKDRAQLEEFIQAGLLVPIADTDAYVIDKTLGEADPDHRPLYAHARPWVKTFLDDVLGEGHQATGATFTVTSLVRTKAYQKALRKGRGNHNAILGRVWWKQSAHLTGAAVDITTLGLDRDAKRWLAKRLRRLEAQGLVEATEEAGDQDCFHVYVDRDYGAQRAAKHSRKRKRPAH